MKNLTVVTLALAGCILFVAPQSALAYTSIQNDWQAYYNVCQPLIDASCTACHTGGTAMNPYGDDMKTAIGGGMTNEEAFVDIELTDSDGDGYTNGQEIVVDCTLPGDPSDHGAVSDTRTTWSQVKALYR